MKNTLFILLFLTVFSSCSKDDIAEVIPVILNDESKITSFKLKIQGTYVLATINETDKLITFDTEDADLTSLIPIIEYSDKSKISPVATLAQNFNNEVVYTILAENGDPSVYRVVVNNVSSNKDILGFQIQINTKIYEGTVDNNAKTLYVESDQVLDLADVIFSLPKGASIAPVDGKPQSFYSPVEYIITAENGTTATFTLTTKAYEFFNYNYRSYYSNATASTSGTSIDLSIPNASVVLENDQNSYILQNTLIKGSSVYSNGMPYNSFSYAFPDNIQTATDYKLKYLIDGEVKTTSSFNIDVLADNVPIIISLNKNLYVRNDILIINGKNLTDVISIPSNGSIFIIKKSGSYDLAVNNERTVLTLTLDYEYLFPSYFRRPKQEKTITLYGANGRVGATINTVFD